MDDDRQYPEAPIQLSQAQADVLRKHLSRETLSLDDAAILVGVQVEDLAQHFTGRRATRAGGERRRRSTQAADLHDREADDETGGALHAPERRSHAHVQAGRSWLWTGGVLAAVAIAGALALLSGVPQSLLFPPRGVSEHKDASAIVEGAAPPAADETLAQPQPDASVAEAPAATAVDPMAQAPQPDAVADPALADPNAAPPADVTAGAENPVPASPEEVAPAIPVGETAMAAEPAPEAPSFAAPEPSSADAVIPSTAGPSTTLYAARAAPVRDQPTSSGSSTLGQLKRGETVSGAIVAGADGKSSWLHIESGPGVGGYVSLANMADAPRPVVVQALGQPRTLTQTAALHAGPDAGSATLDTLSPGISVLAAAEVDGGWIEINRRAGGVGYIRKEAFE